MKTSYSIIIGCIIIAVALIISSNSISKKMYSPVPFPNGLQVTTFDGDKDLSKTNDFISLYEAAAYLRIDDTKLKELIQNGKLNGTFTSHTNDRGEKNYTFSSLKLGEWMKKEIEKGNMLD